MQNTAIVQFPMTAYQLRKTIQAWKGKAQFVRQQIRRQSFEYGDNEDNLKMDLMMYEALIDSARVTLKGAIVEGF